MKLYVIIISLEFVLPRGSCKHEKLCRLQVDSHYTHLIYCDRCQAKTKAKVSVCVCGVCNVFVLI